MTERSITPGKPRMATAAAEPGTGDVSMRVLELATAAVAIAAAVLLAIAR